MFYSVTQRVKSIKQPYGGYLNPSAMKCIQLDDEKILNISENIPPRLIGRVVDYLTRFMLNKDLEKSFFVAAKGAKIAKNHFAIKDAIEKYELYISQISGLDDDSIRYACKLATFDDWYRNPHGIKDKNIFDSVDPDESTKKKY